MRTPEQVQARMWAIETAQFRRGIILGRCRRGRVEAVKDLAIAWLRCSNWQLRHLVTYAAIRRVREAMLARVPRLARHLHTTVAY